MDLGRNITHECLMIQSVSQSVSQSVFYHILNVVSNDVFKENV